MAGTAGEGQTDGGIGPEERRVKSRQERIQGTAVPVAVAGNSGSGVGGGSVTGRGGGGASGAIHQQQR
jgi:hypothetical protein